MLLIYLSCVFKTLPTYCIINKLGQTKLFISTELSWFG